VSAVVTVTEDYIQISTTNIGGSSTFAFSLVSTAPGVYSIGAEAQHAAVHAFPGGASWLANQSIGSGTITLSTFTETRVVGTFAFVLAPAPGGSAISPKRVTLGVFDLTYE
jgi:hypothetical protein